MKLFFNRLPAQIRLCAYSEIKLLNSTYSFWIIDGKVNGNGRAKAWTSQYHWPFDVGLPKLVDKYSSHSAQCETIGRKTKGVLKEI